METLLEAQNIVPQELEYVEAAQANSFRKALEILKSNKKEKRGIELDGPFVFNEAEENSLKLLPEAFRLNRTMQCLILSSLEVDDILVAEAISAGLRKGEVIAIEFSECEKVSNQRLKETMCEGLKERSTGFQLSLARCSSEFVKPILEASYLKCFSLMLRSMDCTGIGRSMTNLCYRGSLYYISLFGVKGLKEDAFLRLGRCLIPNLNKLELTETKVPVSALKRLIGSLKTILDSGRSNVFELLVLGSTQLDSTLSFACFQLLRSDLIGKFELEVKEDISREVVKSISSTVAKTKNLKLLHPWNKFSSGTKFKNFTLQEEDYIFVSPFGVNQTVG